MPGPDDNLGKKAELKIKEWLDKPELGYSFDRIPDQMTGFYGSKNICDFTCFKSPYLFYIESKATYHDNFAYNQLSDTQFQGLLKKSKIENVFGLVVVLFYSYQRSFILDIKDINQQIEEGLQKSINIKKIDKWTIPYIEIETIPSRKQILDYKGNIETYVQRLVDKK